MLLPTIVTNEEELEQIYQLNQQNLKSNLSVEERNEQGFVTWLYSKELLNNMHRLAPSVIVKDEEKVVGYALVTLKESRAFHPDLKTMLDHLEELSYQNKKFSLHNYYLMGQVCIDKAYRGRGVFEMLYQHHKKIYGNRFDMLITEVSTSNIRSQRAHEKVGFKTIHTYPDAMDEWNVIVWDWYK
ncbi:MAG: family N-acetyltransferase [Chitinophagaceae bacterium]|nr:family N-acetyltransferase [Chitinophagaceae bacterium]